MDGPTEIGSIVSTDTWHCFTIHTSGSVCLYEENEYAEINGSCRFIV